MFRLEQEGLSAPPSIKVRHLLSFLYRANHPVKNAGREGGVNTHSVDRLIGHLYSNDIDGPLLIK